MHMVIVCGTNRKGSLSRLLVEEVRLIYAELGHSVDVIDMIGGKLAAQLLRIGFTVRSYETLISNGANPLSEGDMRRLENQSDGQPQKPDIAITNATPNLISEHHQTQF